MIVHRKHGSMIVRGFGDVSTSSRPKRAGLTGVDVIDKFLFEVQDSVGELRTAMTVTTICSLITATGVVGLIIRSGTRKI